MLKLSDETSATIARMKARFYLIQPEGTIKRRGEWCFHKQDNAVKAAAGQPGVTVYDRAESRFLTDVPATPAADEGTTGASQVLADEIGQQPTEAEIGQPPTVMPEDDTAPAVVEPVEATKPDTRIRDSMVETLSNGKPRGQRPSRSNKDGKPKALSAKQQAQQAAGVKISDEPAAKGRGRKPFTGKPKVDRGKVTPRG